MNQYGWWNVVAVFIAAMAFVGTQLTARRNERAEFLMARITALTEDLEKATSELVYAKRDLARLRDENIALMRKLSGFQNGNGK